MKFRKWLMTERMELPNKEKIRMLGEMETNKDLGILEADNNKQVDMKEKKKKENEKTTRKNILQEPNKIYKYSWCTPFNKLRTILDEDEGRR